MRKELDRIPVPKELDVRVNMALETVKAKHRRKVIRTAAVFGGSLAAVFAAFLLFCTANPVLASKLPIIGQIFQKVEKEVSYKGDFSDGAIVLTEDADGNADMEEANAENVETETKESNSYVQSANGITMTVSEVNYSSKAMYLAMSIESEEAFPEDFNRTENMEDYILDYDRMEFMSQGTIQTADGEFSASPHHIEGKFEDEHTFHGIVRVDIDHFTVQPTKEEIEAAGISDQALLEEGLSDDEAFQRADEYNRQIQEAFPEAGSKIVMPDSFTYHMQIDTLWSDLFSTESREVTTPEGTTTMMEFPIRKEYEGPWIFDFDVALDSSKNQTVEIDDTNENGEGIASVEKTPYELSAELILPKGALAYNYFVAICDANGDLLDTQGEFAEVYQVYGRDTSTVYVYVCDATEYLDELKGYYWSDDYEEKKQTKNFAQYLEEHALYGVQVDFEE